MYVYTFVSSLLVVSVTDTCFQLFYSKRSQFVSGLEAEIAPVSVGRSVSGLLALNPASFA